MAHHAHTDGIPAASGAAHDAPVLGIPGFAWADLRSPARLRDLHLAWLARLAEADADLHTRYLALREGRLSLGPEDTSTVLLALAPHVGRFVEQLFGVVAEGDRIRARVAADLVVLRFKDEFVKRRALKRSVLPD